MAQWDVHRAGTGGGPATLFVLDVQSDHVGHLQHRYVLPLMDASAAPVVPDLTPIVAFGEQRLAVMTTMMVRLSRRELGQAVGSLGGQRDVIRRAMDLIFTGF
jgi:hypothetical protein